MLLKSTITLNRVDVWTKIDNENKVLLWILIPSIIIPFAIIKYLYPYPNFISPDSESYLNAAFNNSFINIWPIGYSKFLRAFSCFTNSAEALVWFQFLLLEASIIYCCFALQAVLKLGKIAFRILILGCVLNPLIPNISNFVSSDAIFSALSLFWAAQLFYILNRPSKRLLLIHSIVLAIAFSIRYNSLYYPILSVSSILLGKSPPRTKTFGIGSILFLLGIFITQTVYEYKERTGTIQYSAFGGWQIAANALYGYAHIQPEANQKIPLKYQALHTLVNHQEDSLGRIPFSSRPDRDIGVYYLWDFKSPLILYSNSLLREDSGKRYFIHWAKMAPLYSMYGWWLISKHPLSYAQNFLLPNLLKYYTPPTGFMGFYNTGYDTATPISVKWFGWSNNKISSKFKNKEILIVRPFPTYFAFLNIIFITSLLCFLSLDGIHNCKIDKKEIWIAFAIWALNLLFSVFAAPIEIRYQIFPLTFMYILDVFFIDYLLKKVFQNNANRITKENQFESSNSKQQYIQNVKQNV